MKNILKNRHHLFLLFFFLAASPVFAGEYLNDSTQTEKSLSNSSVVFVNESSKTFYKNQQAPSGRLRDLSVRACIDQNGRIIDNNGRILGYCRNSPLVAAQSSQTLATRMLPIIINSAGYILDQSGKMIGHIIGGNLTVQSDRSKSTK